MRACRREFGRLPSNRNGRALLVSSVKSARRIDQTLLRAAVGVLSCGVLFWTFRDVRLQDVASLLARLGPLGAVWVLLPQLLSASLETAGWRLSFSENRPAFLALLRVRLGTECAAACLPAGVVWAESLKLPLLVRGLGQSVESAVCAIAARKYLLLTSQSLYISIAAVFGWAALAYASSGVLGSDVLPVVVLVSGVVVGGAGLGVRVLLSQGAPAVRLRRLLARAPFAFVRRAVVARSQSFVDTDGRLQRFFGLPLGREAVMTAWFLGGWFVEAVETYLILRLLGVELDFFAVASFEVTLALLRSLVFVVPAGLGVQDAGYVLFLHALGVPDATTTGAAFSLVKRAKELTFAAFGLALLSSDLGAIGAKPPVTT
jgi:glycosyltransferase 2 family protein